MILVTGGTGLVGSHLLYRLVENNEKVRALYRNEDTFAGVKRVFSFFTADAEEFFNAIEWRKADITDISLLTDAFKGITHVYHCAAFISLDESDHKKLRKINIEGTANVVNLCIANQIKKLCYVSSIAALGESPDDVITENTHWNAEAHNSSYAITKYGAEMEVWRGAQEGIPMVIINPGVILGAGFWNTGSGRLFTRIKSGLRYYAEGVTGYVAVEDVADAMIQLMKSTITNKRYVLVAENRSYKELLTTIAEGFGVQSPKKVLTPGFLGVLWRLDWLKSKLSGKQRSITKNMARSVVKVNRYNSEAIKKDLNFKFTPISESITRICSRFTI